MIPTLLLVHGWGFDPSFWEAFRDALPELPTEAVDLGYFGPATCPRLTGPVVVVGHSTGALLALRSPPPECVGLVAINGFDHFVALDDIEGVAPRLLDRMIARLPEDPAATVADFRRRCGDTAPFGKPDPVRLGDHLKLLREADERERSRRWTRRLLYLYGGADPILPRALRENAFTGSPCRIGVHLQDAGHLIPISHTEYCADVVRMMVEDL